MEYKKKINNMSEFNLHQWRNKYLFENDLSSDQQEPVKGDKSLLGKRYDLDLGGGKTDRGFITTGGSDYITSWTFLGDKGKYRYEDVMGKLTISSDQPTKTGKAFGHGSDGDMYYKGSIGESEDHEVSMAMSSIREIISNASQLMDKLGQEERNIPGWIQDHITNAENYINQANKGFHELEYGDDSEEDMPISSISENNKENEEDEKNLKDFENALNQYPEVYDIQAIIKIYNKFNSLPYQDKAKKLAQGKDVLPMPKSSDSSKRRK